MPTIYWKLKLRFDVFEARLDYIFWDGFLVAHREFREELIVIFVSFIFDRIDM